MKAGSSKTASARARGTGGSLHPGVLPSMFILSFRQRLAPGLFCRYANRKFLLLLCIPDEQTVPIGIVNPKLAMLRVERKTQRTGRQPLRDQILAICGHAFGIQVK